MAKYMIDPVYISAAILIAMFVFVPPIMWWVTRIKSKTTMNKLYAFFGPWEHAGHYWRYPNMPMQLHPQWDFKQFNPYKAICIDRQGREDGPKIPRGNYRVEYHPVTDWTTVCFSGSRPDWDKRFGCVTCFVFEGKVEPDEAVKACRESDHSHALDGWTVEFKLYTTA